MKLCILVIDDETVVCDSLKMLVECEGYDCVLARSGQDGIALIQADCPDLVFLDAKMSEMDGLDTLRQIHALDKLLPVVMISGQDTLGAAVEATRLGAFDFLEKPLSSDRVKVVVRNALNQRKLKVENYAWRRAADMRHGTLRHFKEVNERRFLVRNLREFGWNISKTAQEINTPRSNLYRKLERYNISQETDG